MATLWQKIPKKFYLRQSRTGYILYPKNMKKAVKLVLLLAISMASRSAFAQVSFGIKAGLNLANISIDQGRFVPHKLQTAQIGGVVDIRLSENWAIETGLSCYGKGFRINEPLTNRSNHFLYLQVPAHLVCQVDGLFFGAGPYAAVGVLGWYKDSWQGTVYRDALRFGSTYIDDAVRIDYGVGAEIGVFLHPIRISVGFDWGIAKGYRSYHRLGFDTYRHRVLSILVTYLY